MTSSRPLTTLLPRLLGRRSFNVDCTVEVIHTNDELGAHVDLDGVAVGPGDSVLVHGAPTNVAFGERAKCRRTATVTRGGWYDRLWARIAGAMEFNELYDVSFSSRRTL